MMKLFLIIFVLSILVPLFWNQVPIISQTVHGALDPTIGALLNWNVTYGMLIVVALIGLIMVLIQKYFTDQETLREIRKEQKILQEEMKKYKDDPQKLMEFNKKQLEFFPKTMELTMRPAMYTLVFFILFFRWFSDYFTANPVKFFGFLSWFWFYIIFSIVFSVIFRKIFKVV